MIFSLWRAHLKEAYFKPQKHFKELFAYETIWKWFTHPHVVSNLIDFLWKSVHAALFHVIKTYNGDQKGCLSAIKAAY